MGLPNVMQTGRSGMVAAKTAISTAGHNISNANTEGFSRQRVTTATQTPQPAGGKVGTIGRGVVVNRVERINDEYIEQHLRSGTRDLAHFEEKDVMLQQVEDVFNEMSGDGLNRLLSRFFNDFRKLANDPDSEAVRQSVRESSQAMINDFKRLRNEMTEVRRHADSRITGAITEMNSLAKEIRDLNVRIKEMELTSGPPNDLLDKRDVALRKLASFMDVTTHKAEDGTYYVEMRGIGPLVAGSNVESFFVERSKADDKGKPENALDIRTTASASSTITHRLGGGKLGALLEVRDKTVSTIMERLDELAFNVTNAVNQIHRQGYNRMGTSGVDFFKTLPEKNRAAEYIDLSDPVKTNVNHIATAATPNSPGDNRIAIAMSGLQGLRLMGEGTSTVDDYFNSIVGDVGVISARNKSALNQQKNINTQLEKVRDQISGVSIDEETANLLQFQHSFDASAKVIQVADQMLDTVLNMKHW